MHLWENQKKLLFLAQTLRIHTIKIHYTVDKFIACKTLLNKVGGILIVNVGPALIIYIAADIDHYQNWPCFDVKSQFICVKDVP